MTPLFKWKRSESKSVEERIREIFREEKIVKKGEYVHGNIYLTENHLVWIKKKKPDSVVIPLKSIVKAEQATKIGVGVGLKLIYGEEPKEIFFPFVKGRLRIGQVNDVREWVATLEKGEPSKVYLNIIYVGGHQAYPEKHNGQLIITENALIFQGKKDFEIEIPFKQIENISVKTASEISRLTTLLAGPLWSMGFPAKHKFVVIEYTDDIGLKHTPTFDFPLDRGDKKKGEVMRIIYNKIREARSGA